jgi:hypothetical protein
MSLLVICAIFTHISLFVRNNANDMRKDAVPAGVNQEDVKLVFRRPEGRKDG